MTNIFISYSWDSESHKAWVLKLAQELDKFEQIAVTLDRFDLDEFSEKNYFMESAVSASDIIIVVGTKNYAKRADERLGGVGIEASMTISRYWDEISRGKRSNVLLILREDEGVPRFLKGSKLYIDFRSDSEFQSSYQRLLSVVAGSQRVARPKKTHSLFKVHKSFEFDRAEDLLRVSFKKREALMKGGEATDFSGANKIKFEFWRVLTPRPEYFLVLFSNITVSSSIRRFSFLLKKSSLKIEHLTILRPSSGEPGYIESILRESGVEFISISEMTYSDYFWEYCIDESIKNNFSVYQNPYYIDQALSERSSDGVYRDVGDAISYLAADLGKENHPAAYILLASGGSGKSTLCQRLVNYFHDLGGAGCFVYTVRKP